MAKVFLICGKICSGKTTYSQKLCREQPAVLLSCDELMCSLFDEQLGEKHDETVTKVKEYLLGKSLEIIRAGSSAVLDWGFWTRAEREFTKAFYRQNQVCLETHYVDAADEVWRKQVEKRNADCLAGFDGAYYIDEALARKADYLFEAPEPEEIDFVYKR